MTEQGKPTLLSVNNYYYRRGGAETVFFEQNRMFEEAGWRVVPFAMKHPQNLPSPWSEHFVEEIEFGSEYSLTRKLGMVPKVIYSLEARRKLSRVLDMARPDICHAHNIYHHISPSILGLLRRRAIPTVVTLHDLKIACPAYNMLAPDGICERCRGGRLHNVVMHRCVKGSLGLSAMVFAESMLHRLLGSWMHCVDRFVVPSAFYVEKFCAWGFPRERFVHLPNFIDPQRYEPELKAGRHFLYFGRLSREKGVATLLRAAAIAAVPVKIAGTGPQEMELRSLASEQGVDVEFLGHVGGATLHGAIRSARAVVLPSEWYENAPMSILEAYALGKPVIGAGVGGIPELVRPGVTGLIFQSGDIDDLARALRQMADADVLQVAQMGGAARQWAESAFTAQRYREGLRALYRELGVPRGNP